MIRWLRSRPRRGSKRATPKSDDGPQPDRSLAAGRWRGGDSGGGRGGDALGPAHCKARPRAQRGCGVRAGPAARRRRALEGRADRDPGSVAALPSRLAHAPASARHCADAVLRQASGGGAMNEGFAHQAVEDAIARERARIARELHDGIATELAGAISLFKLYLEKHKTQDETLKNVFDIMERSLKRVRESLADLRPAAIGPNGLLGELRHQGEGFARLYGIRVELASNGAEDMLSPQHREVVAQVVREALTNVRRHSASAVCRFQLGFASHPCVV